MALALSLALESAGSSNAARMAMMATTTSNSISVKAPRERAFRGHWRMEMARIGLERFRSCERQFLTELAKLQAGNPAFKTTTNRYLIKRNEENDEGRNAAATGSNPGRCQARLVNRSGIRDDAWVLQHPRAPPRKCRATAIRRFV